MVFSRINLIALFSLFLTQNACSLQPNNMKYNELNDKEKAVILYKGTEAPFIGEYNNFREKGVYVCKQCNSQLYTSDDKFDSHCGWPSFDDEIAGAIKRVIDADGQRTEIICANCSGHLGHVFIGEQFTEKNTRNCVNSISLIFIPDKNGFEKAYFASGCFWGTEYHLMKANGVTETSVGYMGGKTHTPSYDEVCTGTTGHVETTEVIFDTTKTSYEALVKLFFETHNFTQVGGQGPDIGDQYRSVIFYTSEVQKKTALQYIRILTEKGFKVATTIESAPRFWNAEDYHQQYYEKKNGTPYCHIYRKIF
jgi:peptide methionine sulfoxide reductase msrA/msrB